MQPNQKILGAFIVGFALVAGSYTISNFGAKSAPTVTEKSDNDVHA
jgi:hypothetical protein